MKFSYAILGSTLLFLFACGGGGGTSTAVGVFVDAPVEGLTYESDGITGTTDSAGKFLYRIGKTVTFSVNGVTLPSVQGASLITPVDLVGASSPDSPEAVYIARFLQSLDSDGNPSIDGIKIDKSKLATGAVTPANWTTDPLASLVTPAALALAPDEATARNHMKTQIATLSGLPRMSLVGRYSTGGTTANTSESSSSRTTRLYAEIVAYHKLSKSAFITIDEPLGLTSNPTSFARISLSALNTTGMKTNPEDNNEVVSTQNLTLGTPVNVATHVNDGGFTAGGVQSLDISGNLLAIAVANTTKNLSGVIAFYSLDANGAATFVHKVTVGALPDGVAFSPDGKYLVVANEGEPLKNSATSVSDAEGSISIIAITDGQPATSATTLGFTDFNTGGSRASELPAGVRIVRPGATFSQDVEPEYVTISDDSKTAFVTLQEANAVAVVDLATARISKIHALGVKDFGQGKNKIWTNDQPSAYTTCTSATVCAAPTLKNYTNLYGYYLPDGVASFTIAGKTYFLTGNEGDNKDDYIETAAKESARVSEIASSLDTSIFSTTVSTELARLNINKTANGVAAGVNSTTGKYEKLYTYGARSFSIWDADTGAQVFDSGDDFERVVYNDATQSLLFSALRGRMDDKGPEPENIVVGQVGKEYFAFIGLERSSGIMMYQITNPAKPKFVQYIRNTSDAATTGDISPEGLKFIPAADSPTGVPLLLVGYEVTGSMAVFQIK
jgi:DNA-binding beta-propeller fold protein YncE